MLPCSALKPVQILLLRTALLQALPLFLLLFTQLSLKIPHMSPAAVYTSLSLSFFSAPKTLPTRASSVVHGDCRNIANPRQAYTAQPLWHFHDVHVACLGFHCMCLLGCKLGVSWFNWVSFGKSEFGRRLWFSRVWRVAEVYFVVCCLSASYPTAPALDLKGSWAFMVWGMTAARGARGRETLVPTENGKAQRLPQN